MGDVVDRQHPDARRSQLDGERDAVQSPANLADDGRVAVRERESALGGYGALEEEPDRTVGQRLRGRDAPGVLDAGDGQRRRAIRAFAGYAQRLSTRGQDRDPGAFLQNGLGGPGGARDDVFAVVEQQQQVLFAEMIEHGLEHRPVPRLGKTERRRDCLSDHAAIRDRRELDEPNAVVERTEHRVPDLTREARFSNASRAG